MKQVLQKSMSHTKRCILDVYLSFSFNYQNENVLFKQIYYDKRCGVLFSY